MSRIAARFAALKAENRAAFVAFVTAGDPDPQTAAAIMAGLPAAGADIIELGMPFSDPMADGPSVQRASQRALKAGMSLKKTLDQVAGFREQDQDTPVVLMGYFNPIYQYGVDRFLADAREKGVDGLIIVDLPPEEEGELAIPAKAAGIDFIYLTAPTTDDARLPRVLAGASGFVYYVSITGITGTRAADEDAVRQAVERLRRHTDLPLAIGFGIRTPEQAATFARLADAAVVGSAIVDRLADSLDDGDRATDQTVDQTLGLVRDLAAGVRAARK